MKIEINRRNVTSCRSIANSWNGHEIVLRGIKVGNESCFARREDRWENWQGRIVSFFSSFIFAPLIDRRILEFLFVKIVRLCVCLCRSFSIEEKLFDTWEYLAIDQPNLKNQPLRKLIVAVCKIDIFWSSSFRHKCHFPFLIRFNLSNFHDLKFPSPVFHRAVSKRESFSSYRSEIQLFQLEGGKNKAWKQQASATIPERINRRGNGR